MDEGFCNAVARIDKDLEELNSRIDRRRAECDEVERRLAELVVRNTEQSLGARGGVPSWYIKSTLQGNGQCTQHLPAQYISSTFRIFPANFHTVFPAQEIISTFTVSQVM